MKLVDRHEEGQGNPREEVAIDSQMAYVIAWSSQLLPPIYSRFIFFPKVATTLPDLLEKNSYPKSGMTFVTQPFEGLRLSCFRHLCSSSRNLTNLLRCIWGRVILPLADCWCTLDGHCLWGHEAQWLSKETTNSWEKSLRHSTLLGDVATLVGVSQDQGVHEQVSLTYFGIHAQVSAKPLRWHKILALMKVDLIHNVGHDNMVRNVLSEREEFQAISTIQILVANVCRWRKLVRKHKGGVHWLPRSTKASRWTS